MNVDSEFQLLSTDVVGILGATVTYSRSSGGTWSATTRTESGGSTNSYTLSANVEQTRQYTTNGSDGAMMVVEEVVYLLDAATLIALGIGPPKQGDLVTSNGYARRVVGEDLQVQDKMYRVTARSEKKKG